MIRKVVFNTLLYGVAPQVPKFAGLLILPLITQSLTAKDFGLYGIILAYTQAFLYLKTLGTDVVLSNSYFKHPATYRIHWRHINGLLHVWALALAVVLGVVLWFVLSGEPNVKQVIILNCLPVALFTTTENLFFRFYQLQQKPLPISVRVIVTGLINVLVTYYTIHVLQLGYLGWFYGTFISGAIGFLWMIYPIYIKEKFVPVLRLRWRFLTRSLKVSLPVLPHYYGNYLVSSSDRLVLDLLHVNTSSIGRYNASNMIGNFAVMLASAMNKAVGPMLLQYHSKRLFRQLQQLVFLWQILLLIGTSLLCMWLKELIPVLIKTKDIGELHHLAICIVMAVNYMPMYAAANSQLFFQEKTSQLWKRAFVAFSVSIVLNLLFVPYYGISAAAATTFVTYMFLGYSSFSLKAYRESKLVEFYPVRWLLITLTCTVLSLIMVEFAIAYKIAISLALLLSVSILGFRFKNVMFKITR
ncbi:MAG: lipopolysaccharide biosynthesis protein [Cyclobacteriaceae bacterium]|nr:MAG: lipopolysaccharide biosynthesis protein [Cyclobacteriaceae bacterium]